MNPKVVRDIVHHFMKEAEKIRNQNTGSIDYDSDIVKQHIREDKTKLQTRLEELKVETFRLEENYACQMENDALWRMRIWEFGLRWILETLADLRVFHQVIGRVFNMKVVSHPFESIRGFCDDTIRNAICVSISDGPNSPQGRFFLPNLTVLNRELIIARQSQFLLGHFVHILQETAALLVEYIIYPPLETMMRGAEVKGVDEVTKNLQIMATKYGYPDVYKHNVPAAKIAKAYNQRDLHANEQLPDRTHWFAELEEQKQKFREQFTSSQFDGMIFGILSQKSDS